MRELASLGIDRGTLVAALQAQNIVRPSGEIQTGNETVSVRVSGAFRSEQDIASVNFAIGGRMPALERYRQIFPRCMSSAAAAVSNERAPAGRPCHRHA